MSTPERPPSSEPDPKSSGVRPPHRGRPEKSSSSNLVWYILAAAAVALLVNMWFTQRQTATELTFREFRKGLADGRFTKDNVHELQIGSGYITFQSLPNGSNRLNADGKAEPIRKFFIPVVSLPDNDRSELLKELEASEINAAFERPPQEWPWILSTLIVPLLVLVFLIMMFRRAGGAGSALTFGRSRGRMHAQEDLDITFDQVAGIDEAVEELREIVEFLKSPAKYQALGGRIPRGVLLVGPPGTGENAARQGDCRRGRRSFFQPLGFGLRGDVRRRGGGAREGYVRSGGFPFAEHHLHR
jgi:cell division protease FtsH